MKKYIIITYLLFSILSGELIKPANGELLNYKHVLFEWSQSPEAVAYNIEVSTDPSFINLIIKRTYCCCSSCKVCENWRKNSKN